MPTTYFSMRRYQVSDRMQTKQCETYVHVFRAKSQIKMWLRRGGQTSTHAV